MEIQKLLKLILKDDALHARWLNTLSYLEHVGARKIFKSQNSQSLTIDGLRHAFEEARHAYFFKKILVQHFPGQCETYETSYLLGGSAGNHYFQTLDKSVTEELDAERTLLNYGYVTWLVEKRALNVYRLYSEKVGIQTIKSQLRGLLHEEAGHLEEMEVLLKERDALFVDRSERLMAIENELYLEMLGQMSSDVLSKDVVASETETDTDTDSGSGSEPESESEPESVSVFAMGVPGEPGILSK